MKKHFKKYQFSYSLVSIISLMILTVWFIGSQMIWIPVIALSLLFLSVPRVQGLFMKFEMTTFVIFVLPLFIGLCSTVYQFWQTPVIMDFTLGTCLLLLATAITLEFFVAFPLEMIKRRITSAKIKKRVQKEQLQKKEKEEQLLIQSAHKKRRLIDAITSNHSKVEQSWDDILSLSRNPTYDICDWQYIVQACLSAPLDQLITVSVIKKQIVWRSDLISAFSIVETIFKQSYDDALLKKLEEQVFSLVNPLQTQYKSYAGAERLLHELKEKCPRTFSTFVESV